MGLKLYAKALTMPLDAFREGDDLNHNMAVSVRRRNKLAMTFLASIADDETGVCWCNDRILAVVINQSYANVPHRARAMQDRGMFVRAKLQIVRDGTTLNSGVSAYSLTMLTNATASLEELMRPYLDAYLDTPYGPTMVLEGAPEWAWLSDTGSIMVKQMRK